MKKIVRQERLKDDKKARLIEAAIEEFNKHGLQNASYNRIIERSGLSKGAVYYYFENKDALFCTVLEDIGERFLEAIKGLELPETREAYWDAAREHRRREVAFFVANPSFGRILMILSEHDLSFDDPFWRAFERPIRFLSRFIEAGQRLGAVRDDLGAVTIQRLMWAVGKVMNLELFGAVCCGGTCADGEVERISHRYLEVMNDLSRRMLAP